jgi:hypothetical protein
LIGRHAVKARVRAAAIVTGPFFAGFSIRIIRGRADKSACTQRSTSLMTFFSAARWKVRKRIDGWRSQPGCSIAPDVLQCDVWGKFHSRELDPRKQKSGLDTQ